LTKVLQSLCYLIAKILFLTYRLKITYSPKIKKPFNKNNGVFFAWHQNIIASAAFLTKNDFNLHCIISPSQDGKFAGAITEKLGLKTIYGSAHKKPVALVRKSLEVLDKEKQIFLIGDGSRGPAKKLQRGVTYLSEKSELPLIFVDCKVEWKITIKKSWDKFQIPLPFSKIYINLR